MSLLQDSTRPDTPGPSAPPRRGAAQRLNRKAQSSVSEYGPVVNLGRPESTASDDVTIGRPRWNDLPDSCSACHDHGQFLQCTFQNAKGRCPVKICTSKRYGELGCVVADSVKAEFVCPLCLVNAKKAIPYTFDSYNMGIKPSRKKTLAPFLVIGMKLGKRDSVTIDMLLPLLRSHYTAVPENLCFLPLAMQHAGANTNKLQPAWSFIEAASGRAHCLVVVDTHSDSYNGRVVHTASSTHGTRSADMSEVLASYLSTELLCTLAIMPDTIRGLALMVCGSVMTSPVHFPDLRSLVERDFFTFVIGFSGISVVPTSVVYGLLQFLVEAFIMGQDPWKSLETAIAGDLELLKHTSVTLVFRQSGLIQCRTLVLSIPPTRVWGLSLLGCPKTTCSAKPLDVRSEVHRKCAVFHERARFSCTACGFRTGWIQRPPWVHEVGVAHPRRFWFDFPVHFTHFATFTDSLLAQKVTYEDSAYGQQMDVDE